MAFWPSDERTKHKVLDKQYSRNYPNIEPGLIGAATLIEDDNNLFKWDFLPTHLKRDQGHSSRPLKFGKQSRLFPSTKTIVSYGTSRSTRQRAEQGANFLRTYLPDVEITSELIRDQLTSEATLRQNLDLFDPYAGNTVEILRLPEASDSEFLLFPTGETSSNLSFSSVKYMPNSKITFKPSAAPLHTFSTPIQQITTTRFPTNNDVVIRTYSSTQIFKVTRESIMSATGTMVPLITISRADTKGEEIVDVKHIPSTKDILVIGDDGTTFRCTVNHGIKSLIPIHANSTNSDEDNLWRLSLGSDPSSGFVVSDKRVQQFDIRTKSINHFYSIPSGRHKLTSVEDYIDSTILPLCSTDKITWMDVRFARKPLLTYCHGRQYDRNLSTYTQGPRSSRPLTFLTSRSNAMVSVYDVSRSVDGLVHLNALPYIIPGNVDMYQRNISQCFIFRGGHMGLARLSEDQGLHFVELLPSISMTNDTHSVKFSRDMQELLERETHPETNVGPAALQEYAQADLHLTYDALFKQHFEELKVKEEAETELLYQLVEDFPSYLQNKEQPADYLLTTSDILFGACDEHEHTSRAEFLSESIIHSRRGYRALKQGRLSPQSVKSSWHRSILSSLRRLDPDFPSDPMEAAKYLATYNLPDSKKLSQKARAYEEDACEVLAMDLALSSDVYSDIPIFTKSSFDNTLESLTEALSIGGEPPPVQFRYLKPVYRASRSEQENGQSTPQMPLGVRLLLKDWDMGNPGDYFYQDPYNAAPLEPLKKMGATELQIHHYEPNMRLQKPPKILASNIPALPEIPRKTDQKVQSQDRFSMLSGLQTGSLRPVVSSSQELEPSTQVLPGPHGGRPGTKKKTTKKRLGGF